MTMAMYSKKGLAKPLVIFLAAIGLGMFVLGLTLTIIGTLPGYAPYGGNPLKIVGPILLVLGLLVISGVIVEWCVSSQRRREETEKTMVDYSQPKATFNSSSYSRNPKQIRAKPIKKYEPPLQTSTPGNVTLNPSPAAFRPEDILPQSQALLAQSNPQNGARLPKVVNSSSSGQNVGYNPPRATPVVKSAHFEPIHREPTANPAPQYAQIVHPQRQQSASSGNYFFPSVTNNEVQGRLNSGKSQSNGFGTDTDASLSNQTKQRWGNSKEYLDDQQDIGYSRELPMLDINNAGKDNTTRLKSNKGKAGPGDKYSHIGSQREVHREKPTKSPRTQRRAGGHSEMADTNRKVYTENEGYTREMGVDVGERSSREYEISSGQQPKQSENREAQQNNFSRRNSSRTRRGSKRKPRGERRVADDRDLEREWESSREKGNYDRSRDRGNYDRTRDRSSGRERSSSRGRLGLDDSTTLDYVRGVPIDKDSRRRAPSNNKQSSSTVGNGDSDSDRHRRHRQEPNQRRQYDASDSQPSTSPSDFSHPTESRSRHKHSGGHHNGAFINDNDRALTPKMSPEEFLNSQHVKDSKNMNFTININAQPGSAVQIALGNKDLPTPKPMITATPLKSEVRTHMPGMSDA